MAGLLETTALHPDKNTRRYGGAIQAVNFHPPAINDNFFDPQKQHAETI